MHQEFLGHRGLVLLRWRQREVERLTCTRMTDASAREPISTTSSIFDSENQSLKNWARFDDVDGFNDKASAVRWCIPPGSRVRLYNDSNYQGSFKDLVGDGTLHEVNLNSNGWGFGDNVSSARWLAW